MALREKFTEWNNRNMKTAILEFLRKKKNLLMFKPSGSLTIE